MPISRGTSVIGWLYRKIFVAIVPDGGAYEVRLVIFKQKKLLSKESRRFEGEDAHKDMAKFLRKRLDESPLHYVAVLNPDPNQGALLGCSLHDVSEALSGAKTLCRNHKWLLYASIRELDGLKKEYASIGLDFVFSPFSVIERFFGDKISGPLALYALALKDSFSVAFFEDGKLEFAHHFPLHRNEGAELGSEEDVIGFSVGVEEEDLPSGINLDDIESLDDLDIIDELDDLSDIEDLDSLEEIVDFKEDTLTQEESRASQTQGDEIKGEMDRFNEDYKRFELIEKILARFYGSEQCHNRFIETVYIADAYGSGNELKQYLEDELFLNVLVRRIDVADEVIALAMDEEGL